MIDKIFYGFMIATLVALGYSYGYQKGIEKADIFVKGYVDVEEALISLNSTR